MTLNSFVRASTIAAPLLLLCSSLYATSITGTANIAGNVSVTNSAINFAPAFTTANASESGSFSGLTSGSIGSLTGGPATGSVSQPNFVTFDGGVASPVIFDLTFIAPGVGNLADCSSSSVRASCTPAGSPFTLIQLSSNTVLVSLQLNGEAYTGSKASGFSPVASLFTTQIVSPGTIPQILALLNSGGVNGQTYSASFIAGSAVPEPGAILLLGMGLVAVGVAARRGKTSKV